MLPQLFRSSNGDRGTGKLDSSAAVTIRVYASVKWKALSHVYIGIPTLTLLYRQPPLSSLGTLHSQVFLLRKLDLYKYCSNMHSSKLC